MDIALMRKIFRFPIAAGLAIAAAMAVSAPARAGLVIELSTDGVHWNTVASAGSGSVASYTSSNYHGFNISVLSDDSNSPGTPTLAYLEGSAVHVTNNNAGIATLYLKLGDTGFTYPINPALVTLDSQIGGSVTVGGKDNNLLFESYVDPADGLASTAGFTTGPQVPNITGKPKSYADDHSILIANGLTNPYSVTEYFKLTLDPKSQVGFQSSTNLSASVPEPSSLVLSAIGILGMAGYAWCRRRRPGPIRTPAAQVTPGGYGHPAIQSIT
jgi:PEP-CTERM motif